METEAPEPEAKADAPEGDKPAPPSVAPEADKPVPTPATPSRVKAFAAFEAASFAQVAALTALVDAKRWSGAAVVADAVARGNGLPVPLGGSAAEPAVGASRPASSASAAGSSRRSRPLLDALGARLWHLSALAWERTGRGPASVPTLLAAHARAARRRDDPVADSILNALLRAYVQTKQYDAAAALAARATTGAPPRSMAAAARRLYYAGVVAAVRLDYQAARDSLALAARRAPESAVAFRAAVAGWAALVDMLLGTVPGRAALLAPPLGPRLAPYAALARAVRVGDPAAFAEAKHDGAKTFARHGTTLVVDRLRASVVRAGLAGLSRAYVKLPLDVAATRLGLPSARDAADLAARAVRDGALEASIERAPDGRWCLAAPLAPPPLAGAAPGRAFHLRIAFCCDVHDDAVRAMRHETLARERIADADAARERAEHELQAALDEVDD